jgi:hypothetical protein
MGTFSPRPRDLRSSKRVLVPSHVWNFLKVGLKDRTGQDRTGQDRTGQDRTGQDRIMNASSYHTWMVIILRICMILVLKFKKENPDWNDVHTLCYFSPSAAFRNFGRTALRRWIRTRTRSAKISPQHQQAAEENLWENLLDICRPFKRTETESNRALRL